MHLSIWHRVIWKVLCLLIIIHLILIVLVKCNTKGKNRFRFHTRGDPSARKVCIKSDQTMHGIWSLIAFVLLNIEAFVFILTFIARITLFLAQHKSCFLRPDTGPCRADIIQWYYDVKQSRCYRFYWGGCQGNGNRFETLEQCNDYCYLDAKNIKSNFDDRFGIQCSLLPLSEPEKVPFFCSLEFEYGRCFGYFHRFTWDSFTKTCRRRVYSGCGGNQNNFQTRLECMRTCLSSPNNTLENSHHFTTCIPLIVPELQ